MHDTARGRDGTVREARRPCVAPAVLALAALAAAGCGSRPAQGPPNVLWIVIDAQRADHLGCYGHDRDTSPFLDALAAEGLRFTNAISQESYTQASVPSYFTSTYPLQHRVLYDQPTIDVLAPRFLTIAETLKTAGYTTAAFVFNPHLKARFGFGQGFDLYDDDPAGWPEGVPLHEAMETARKIHGKLERYLTETPTRPLFLYLHYRDVHSPYAPPPPFHELFLPAGVEPAPDLLYTERPDRAVPHTLEVVLSQYDGEIRYTDTQLRETLRLLERFGITRTNSVIVITADHGEEFHDRHPDDPGGLFHGRTLYGEQIRVPLILLLPDVRPARRVIDAYVELVDVVPTVLDAVGIDWKRFGQFRGTSLLPLIEHGEAPERTVYAGGNHGRGILIAGDWKYYRYDKGRKHDRKRAFHRPLPGDASEVGEELYNIREDPGETKNRIATRPDVAVELRRQLDDIEATMTAETEANHLQMDEQTRTQLEALGYL